MSFDRVPRICSKCGDLFEVGLAPDFEGRCERCQETFAAQRARSAEIPGASGEVLRRGIFSRLRAYYAAAREFVDSKISGDPHHANLEWFLGSRSHPDRHDSISSDVSEAMVLWLEDLASEIEVPAAAPGPRSLPAERVPAHLRRESAARGLRVATREFANAFRAERAVAASRP
jgi:hypothetical protein